MGEHIEAVAVLKMGADRSAHAVLARKLLMASDGLDDVVHVSLRRSSSKGVKEDSFCIDQVYNVLQSEDLQWVIINSSFSKLGFRHHFLIISYIEESIFLVATDAAKIEREAAALDWLVGCIMRLSNESTVEFVCLEREEVDHVRSELVEFTIDNPDVVLLKPVNEVAVRAALDSAFNSASVNRKI